MNDKDARTYIRVHDGIIDHPKVEPLTDRAFRLLLESWCYCSRHLTDGRIPLAVWRKRGTAKARRELVDAGLVEQHDEYVTMHDYLEHQRSADEVEEEREARRRAGALGNHNRWHVPRGIYDPECPICVANGQQQGSPEPSQDRSRRDRKSDRKTSPETETETETETQLSSGHLGEGQSPTERASSTPSPENLEGTRPADRCPRHRNVDDPPNCGQCADHRRAAEAWDARQAAERQRVADEIDHARRDPRMRCQHGADGGLYIRPDTGQSATCAQCRRSTERHAS